MTTTFTVYGRPKSKERPRMSRGGHVFTPATTKAAETKIAIEATKHCDFPSVNPIRMSVGFFFKPAKSWPKEKKARALVGELPHVTVPDLDNLLKLVKDALNGVVYIDDSQVIQVSATKSYGEVDATVITIQELTGIEVVKAMDAASNMEKDELCDH